MPVKQQVAIENIEEMRRLVGIEDVELRQAIRGLRVGDHVRLTLLADAHSSGGETILVRITSIRGHGFRGKLAGRPATPGLTELEGGASFAFTAAHIHSLPNGRPAPGD